MFGCILSIDLHEITYLTVRFNSVLRAYSLLYKYLTSGNLTFAFRLQLCRSLLGSTGLACKYSAALVSTTLPFWDPPCCLPRVWWATESSPVYASAHCTKNPKSTNRVCQRLVLVSCPTVVSGFSWCDQCHLLYTYASHKSIYDLAFWRRMTMVHTLG